MGRRVSPKGPDALPKAARRPERPRRPLSSGFTWWRGGYALRWMRTRVLSLPMRPMPGLALSVAERRVLFPMRGIATGDLPERGHAARAGAVGGGRRRAGQRG